MNWMHQVDSGRSELREMHDLHEARMDARFAEFRETMRADMNEFKHEMRSEIAALRLELHDSVTGFDAKMECRFNDLLKWSFVFWCGAVGAIAALAKVLH